MGMMANAPEVFTVLAYDLNTNTRLAELPAKALRFSSRLNDPGSISFTVDLKAVSRRVANVLAYQGNPFACYVDLNGVIVWGGIMWTTNYQKVSGDWELGGKEFQSWADARVAVADYSDVTYPAGIDPAQLIYKVYTDAQNPALAGAGASIGLQVNSITTGIPAVIPGYPLSQHTKVSAIAADMAAVMSPGAGGIDVSVSSRWDANGNPQNQLTVWTPRVGRAAGQSGLIFDLDRALDYGWPTDATQSGNTIIATGSGNGAAAPLATVQAPGVPVGGLGQAPRLDKVVSYQSVQSQGQITLMANGAAQQFGRPLATPTIKIPTAGRLGTWIVGDDARLYTDGDERHPNGLDQYWRIVQHEVSVPGDGVPTVTLTFNIPPVF
jgi:hypothetical protein